MSEIYYKGDVIFLYMKFYDINNKEAKDVKNAKVRILHTKNENIYEDLPWSQMSKLSDCEYYFNYLVPYDCEYGLYDVIYSGIVDGNEATTLNSFHIINKSQQYTNAIKIYGYITDDNSIPLTNVDVQINSRNNEYYAQAYTRIDGYWESYLYPDEYNFTFEKEGFIKQDIVAQIGTDETETQFNNIVLESTIKKQNGNGICKVTDIFMLKNGIPLDQLSVEVSNINNPIEIIASDLTDKNGEWTLFLDPGHYFLRIHGTSMDQEFNKTFKLDINDDLQYNIVDINNNIAIAADTQIGTGNGNKIYKDKILDSNSKPIVDVQVNIMQNNKIIAQTYTNILGEYEFHLNSGKYIVDIYHPSFKDINNFEITI